MSTSYEVLAVRYGTLETRRSDVYYRYHVYREPDAPIVMDYYFWIIRSAERMILLDTGFGTEPGTRRGRTSLIEPVAALASLGIAPSEVTEILVSHCHYDHIGNLAAFPSASIVIEQREFEFWTGPYASRAQFADPSEQDEIAYLSAARDEGRVRLLNGDGEIAPGIDAVLVGGHCPGQLITVVQTGTQPTVLASDALHFYEEMTRDMPFVTFSDLPATYDAYDLLRTLERDGATIIAGHDPLVMERFGDRQLAELPSAVRVGG